MSLPLSPTRSAYESEPDQHVEGSSAADRTADQEVYSGLRIVRTLAMLSVIGGHILWRPAFGVAFGVTSLQIVMCALQSRTARARRFGEVARRRSLRLLAPWAAWCGIYGLIEVAKAWRWGQPVAARFDQNWWLAGTSFHLWFLPFAFFASLLANRLHRGVEKHSPGASVVLFSLLGAVLVLAAPTLNALLHTAGPLVYWVDGLGTIAFGVAIGRALSIRDSGARQPWFLLILACAVLPLLLASGSAHVHERYGVAVALVCAGFMLRSRDSSVLTLLATYNLGVYLVHVLVLQSMERFPVLAELSWTARLGLCYALCLLAVAGLRRLRVPYLV